MKRTGRKTDQALLRTVASKKAQTFATKRLMKDLEEIQKEKIPTVGVTARPLEHDLFIWHANIRGPEGTPYEGGVFHLELQIPASYPHHPPNVKLFTEISHPNVFGQYICLDMLQINNRKEGQGWSSGYSIQSILMQLQSFLFQEDLRQEKSQQLLNIKKAVKNANEYKCTERNCKHGGRLSCWPSFSTHQTASQDFLTLDTERELVNKELICYHTKLHFTLNQLGIGLKISKLPRTGAIREAEAMFDYISIKAFNKESITWSSSNERFTHWLPIYFGKTDNADKYYKFAKKALAMIITGNTKNFKPEQILQVFPKIMITLIYYIMDEKKHASIRILRILAHVHSCFLFLMQKHPELEASIIKTIDNFIASEEYRIKQNQPNLGCILAMMSVTDKRRFKDIVDAYFSEQLDRQVLWILKQVPELVNPPKDEQDKQNLEKVRAQLVFKTQTTSFQILCFYKLFLTEVCEGHKSPIKLLQHYEENLCKLTNKEEVDLQKKLFAVVKEVKDFDSFFTFVGLKKRTTQQINEMLVKAISNSSRKKYHGEFEDIHNIPDRSLQLQKLSSKFAGVANMFEITMEKKGKQYEAKVVEKTKASEQDWKVMCSKRWAWIKEELMFEPNTNADFMSQRATFYLKEGMAKPQDRLYKTINLRYRNRKINYNEPTVPLPKMTWKTLYLRLDLQEFLIYLDMNANFKELYEKLALCKFCNLNTLVIPIVPVENLKSGYHYLTSVLSKLTTLKYLQFSGLSSAINNLDEKAAKAIKKGLNNFKEDKGELEVFSYQNFNVGRDFSDYLLSHLHDSQKLSSVKFESTQLLAIGNTAKVFNSYLSSLYGLTELKLNRCSLNVQQSKLLADSLMRLKNLRVVEVKGNSAMGMGLPAIIYNLAFSPRLALLDVSQSQVNTSNDQIKELVVSIEKLFKISVSVEVLKASRVNGLNLQLSKEFWASVGECKSLRVIDLSYSGALDGKVSMLGFAVAYNAKKKGSLEYLNTTGCFTAPGSLNSLYANMNINEYDEETWYGDPNKVAKMISANYPKKFYNNLKALQLDQCSVNVYFNLTQHNKLTVKEDPDVVKLIARSERLQTFSLCQTNQQKSMAEVLYLALDPERQKEFSCRLKVLNLSKNSLGKEGAKMLAQAIRPSKTLQVLDISKNYIGVSGAQAIAKAVINHQSLVFLNLFNNKISFDGAKAMAEVLAHNSVIECLDLGHNRIRDKGLTALVDSLVKNPSSKLKILALRFDFLTSKGIEYLFDAAPKMKNQLDQVYIRNNLIDEAQGFNLSQKHSDLNLKISVDIFEKLKYLEPERLERTIWLHPVTGFNAQQIKNFFENTHKCGVVLSVRIRRGKKYPNRNQSDNMFALVQFADPISVTHALHLASKKWTVLNGLKFRVYRSGTGTFIFMKKTAKQRKIEEAKKLLPPLPYDMPAPAGPAAQRAPVRRGGRGGPRGRPQRR